MKRFSILLLAVVLIGALGVMTAVPVSAPGEDSPSLSSTATDSEAIEYSDTPGLAASVPQDGLVTQNGQTGNDLSGEKQTGLQYIDGKAYIFDESGEMCKSGWYSAEGSSFYLNDNGAGVVKCWRLGEDGKYRYLKADGTMAVNEWIIDYGMIYYVGEDGKKFTGSQTIDGVAYQFDEDGVLVSGLIGLQYISGKAYIFDENGHMQKSGWYTVDGDYFYLNDNGAGVVSCWRLGEDGKYRYLKADGRMAVNEWIVDYGDTYYVGEDGRKFTGTQTIDGQTCIFDADGVLISDTIITGLRYIDGKAYIFDEAGVMCKSGWYTAGGDSFYLNDNGAGVVSCWRLGEDGKYRYLKADGTMAVNEWVVDYGIAYYVGGDGKKYTGTRMIDGKSFTFDQDGKLVSGPTGLHYICGRAYIFDQYGNMQKSGRFVADGYTFYLDEEGAGVFSS